jgi:hypothetical protein
MMGGNVCSQQNFDRCQQKAYLASLESSCDEAAMSLLWPFQLPTERMASEKMGKEIEEKLEPFEKKSKRRSSMFSRRELFLTTCGLGTE